MQRFVIAALTLLSDAAAAAEPPFKAGPKQEWQPQPARIVCVAADEVVLEVPLAWVLMETNAEGKSVFKDFVDPAGHRVHIGAIMLAANCAVQRLRTPE